MARLFHVRGEGKDHSVRAISALKERAELCVFSGKPITYNQTLKLGRKESFAFQVAKDLYLYLDEPYRYFNHSCDPNCGVMPDLKMITLKPVRENEELRWDYSTSMMEHHWTMKCNCQKPNCRKVIADFITLPKEQQLYYLERNVVQQFIVDTLRKK